MKTPTGYVALRKGRQIRNCIFLNWCDAEEYIMDYDEAEYSVIDTLQDAEKYIIIGNNDNGCSNIERTVCTDNTLDNQSPWISTTGDQTNTNTAITATTTAPSPPPLPPATIDDIDTDNNIKVFNTTTTTVFLNNNSSCADNREFPKNNLNSNYATTKTTTAPSLPALPPATFDNIDNNNINTNSTSTIAACTPAISNDNDEIGQLQVRVLTDPSPSIPVKPTVGEKESNNGNQSISINFNECDKNSKATNIAGESIPKKTMDNPSVVTKTTVSSKTSTKITTKTKSSKKDTTTVLPARGTQNAKQNCKPWMNSFEEFASYRKSKRKYPNKPMPRNLKYWRDTQNKEFKKKIQGLPNAMYDEREELLRSIGFVFSLDQKIKDGVIVPLPPAPSQTPVHEKWKINFDKVAAFQNPDGIYPKAIPDYDLRQWLYRQKYEYKKKRQGLSHKLPDKKEELLRSIGVAVFLDEKADDDNTKNMISRITAPSSSPIPPAAICIDTGTIPATSVPTVTNHNDEIRHQLPVLTNLAPSTDNTTIAAPSPPPVPPATLDADVAPNANLQTANLNAVVSTIASEKSTTSTAKMKIGKKWKMNFDKLASYRKPDGTYPQPIPDSHVQKWLNTQIFEYRIKLAGQKTSLHDEKEQLLRSIGVTLNNKPTSSKRSRASRGLDQNVSILCKELPQQELMSETRPKKRSKSSRPSAPPVTLQEWKDDMAKLKQYMDANDGDWNFKTINDPKVRTWIIKQQAHYLQMKEGKPSLMDEEKLAMLQEIGVDFDKNAKSWSEQIEQLKVSQPNNSSLTSHSLNIKGGSYKQGVPYSLEKKIEVVLLLEKLRTEHPSGKNGVSARSLAKAAKISIMFACRVIKEVDGNGVLYPTEYTRHVLRGAGAKVIADSDEIVLLRLRRQNPRRSLSDYQHWLQMITGNKVSDSVISRWFKDQFPYKGNVKKGNKHPMDKYTVDNIESYREFIASFCLDSLSKIKFCDEKQVTGTKIFREKRRVLPLTGVEPDDFCYTYTITSFCGIDESLPAIDFTINKCTNNDSAFCDAVDAAIARKFIKEGDVLVIDNAAIHGYCESVDLEEFLWDCYGIIVVKVKLENRSFDLNPIQLVWNILIERLRNFSFNGPGKDAFANAATSILEKMQHSEIIEYYKKCGYNPISNDQQK